jgi:hypothetical protein
MSAIDTAIDIRERVAPGETKTALGTWMPRSGREAAAGCVWLPRMIDKARRVVAGEATGQDLLWPYCFGVNDPADTQLLRFLRLTNEDVLDVVRREPDDAAAAAEIVRRSGRTPEECAAWSARYLRRNAPFLAMIDADEGRRPTGASTTLLRVLYNGVIMPPYYGVYRVMERQRLARAGRGDAATDAGMRAAGRYPVVLASGVAALAVGGAVWWGWRARRRAQQRRTWRGQLAERARGAAERAAARAAAIADSVA